MTERYLIHLQGEVQTGDLDPETLLYKRECLNAIRKTWPEFSNTSISKLTRSVLENFRVAYRGIYSATRTNGSITVLRELLESAVEDGQLANSARVDPLKKVRYTEVDYDYKRRVFGSPRSSLCRLDFGCLTFYYFLDRELKRREMFVGPTSPGIKTW